MSIKTLPELTHPNIIDLPVRITTCAGNLGNLRPHVQLQYALALAPVSAGHHGYGPIYPYSASCRTGAYLREDVTRQHALKTNNLIS